MWQDSKHHGSSLGRLQWTDSQLAETCLDPEPSLHVLRLKSLRTWRPLIFPLGAVTSSSCLLSCVVSLGLHLWATLLPSPHCPPLLTLFILPWGVSISPLTCATQMGMAGPVPRYSRNFYLHICLPPHPPQNLLCPMPTYMLFSLRIPPLLGMALWFFSIPRAQAWSHVWSRAMRHQRQQTGRRLGQGSNTCSIPQVL